MKNKNVIDSYALLAYLKKEKGHLKVKKLFLSDDNVLLINDINIGETFYILAKERGMQQAEYFLEVILPNLPLKHITNTFADVIEAAKIKSLYPISFADCFVAATAKKENASIVTGDPEFKKLEKEVNIIWI